MPAKPTSDSLLTMVALAGLQYSSSNELVNNLIKRHKEELAGAEELRNQNLDCLKLAIEIYRKDNPSNTSFVDDLAKKLGLIEEEHHA